MRYPLLLLACLSLILSSACAHTYYKPTGLPTDVQDRFYFHMDHEAQERGLRTARSEDGLTVYASAGRITYGPDVDEIVATFTVPNRQNATPNYYRQKRDELIRLSDQLLVGARKRARQAQDFAY